MKKAIVAVAVVMGMLMWVSGCGSGESEPKKVDHPVPPTTTPGAQKPAPGHD